MSQVEQSAEEQTFKEFTPAQAKAYAANRSSHQENLFKVILEHHDSTAGTFGMLLDVGCGPGNSTRPLAKHFAAAYGIDPSRGMIDTAKAISAEAGAETTSGKPIAFIEGRAEDINGTFRDVGRKIDLLTAGMAVSILSVDPHPSVLILCRRTGSTCGDSGPLQLGCLTEAEQ